MCCLKSQGESQQPNSTAGSGGRGSKANQYSWQLPTEFHRLHTLRQLHMSSVEPGWRVKAASILCRTSVGRSAMLQAAAIVSPVGRSDRANYHRRAKLSSALQSAICFAWPCVTPSFAKGCIADDCWTRATLRNHAPSLSMHLSLHEGFTNLGWTANVVITTHFL